MKNEEIKIGWHKTENITPCDGGMSGKPCGKITEHMYPIYGKFVCEEHRGTFMGMPLCCSECFEPYWPNFPERMFGEGDMTGHCGIYMMFGQNKKCCHG